MGGEPGMKFQTYREGGRGERREEERGKKREGRREKRAREGGEEKGGWYE